VVTIIVLKFLGGVVLVGISLLGVVIGVFLLTNRNGLADRFQQHEEDDAVAWSGPVGLRHKYFRRVVRLYALGLIAWGAFYPCIALASWLGPATAGIFHALAAVSLLAMFGIAFAMGWHSERTLTALGLPVLSFGLARVRSVPFQVNATFWAALSAGILVDFLGTLTLGLK
jgi:FtsH-binding integral membrane protein